MCIVQQKQWDMINYKNIMQTEVEFRQSECVSLDGASCV